MNGSAQASTLESSGQAADSNYSADEPGKTSEHCPYANKTWIEIQLIGEDDKPIPDAKYRVELPDGTVEEGTLDREGVAGFFGLDQGNCKITFPALDQDAWEPV